MSKNQCHFHLIQTIEEMIDREAAMALPALRRIDEAQLVRVAERQDIISRTGLTN